jgi:pimeloyl-ACP methyl ester carboxylesterase
MLSVDGETLHIVEAAEIDQPPILLLHGLGMDWRVWQSVARRLTRHFHVFMVDLRGHGQSAKPVSEYTLADYAFDIEGLVELLQLERAVLVGSSLGGLISVVVESSPEVISHRVLVDPPFRLATLGPRMDQHSEHLYSSIGAASDSSEYPDATVSTRRLFRDILQIKQSRTPDSGKSAALIEALRGENPGAGELGLRYMAETWLAASDGVLEAAIRGWGPQIRTSLESIEVPTLVMRGNPALGGVLSEGAANEVRSLVPHAEIKYFEKAGHAIHAAAPQLFVDSILEFVASGSSGIAQLKDSADSTFKRWHGGSRSKRVRSS